MKNALTVRHTIISCVRTVRAILMSRCHLNSSRCHFDGRGTSLFFYGEFRTPTTAEVTFPPRTKVMKPGPNPLVFFRDQETRTVLPTAIIPLIPRLSMKIAGMVMLRCYAADNWHLCTKVALSLG